MSGRVAVVSGAAQGLGQAFAERLAGEGYAVIGFDTNAAVSETDAFQGVQADVSSRADVERIMSLAADTGDLAVVVNNAGTWRPTPVDSAWPQALEDWSFIMDTNFKGAMLLGRAAVPLLRAAGST